MGTETAEASDDRYVPVAEAAARTGVPRRSIYRWRAEGDVSTREVGGQVLVLLGDVKGLAGARRKPAPVVAPVAVAPPVAAPVVWADGFRADDPRCDGRLASAMFKLFSAGRTPVQVVELLEQPPRAVLSMFQEWLALDAPTEPNFDQRLLAVEADHAELKAAVTTKVDLVDRLDHNTIDVQSLQSSMHDVRRRLALLEQAPR
jgi:hypothetical protein